MVVTDIHINPSKDGASVHHIDSHGSLSHHQHTEHADETSGEEHCCHAYTSVSLTPTPHFSITTDKPVASSFPLPDGRYRNPHLDRLQRPPKA